LVAIIGVTIGFNHTHPDPNDAEKSIADNIPAVNSQIAFIAISIFFFASTWGPGAWILIGEIFPLPIRSRGVALSTASNWLWNTVIAVITPYMAAPLVTELARSKAGRNMVVCNLLHALAIAHLAQGETDEALATCQQAFLGKK
ncbi:hypothetical protein BN1708_017187, partial [Verticillium longisporum]